MLPINPEAVQSRQEHRLRLFAFLRDKTVLTSISKRVNENCNMTDVEASSRPTPGAVNNPYSNSEPPPILHHWHPVNVLRRCIYMGGSLYGLNYFSAYDTLMNSPDVSHEWFKIGLASTVGKSGRCVLKLVPIDAPSFCSYLAFSTLLFSISFRAFICQGLR